MWRNAGRFLCTAAPAEEAARPIYAAAVLERLPVYRRPPHPTVAKFKELSKKWKQMIGEIDVFENSIPDLRKAKPDVAEPTNNQTLDKRSLERALHERLYLIVHGTPSSKSSPVWHFPEKVYTNEENLRQCAESALETLLGELSEVYFAGSAPSGHLELPDLKRFYFRSHYVGKKDKLTSAKYSDYAWVSRDELIEYLDASEMEILQHMLPSF